ncbi:hypothetical protein SAMN04488018_13015 [Myroides marinus]|uniref:Uncharacterized protein n=1 Tax=Myroides marinus TaxID=703342 RepID=A0A1H6YA94_9FLAO|nr:hypothetical protein [Myroides marinus]SEJ38223.1 hypothetical protein SAMN04488018_13015 [Myroides marinus]
MVDINKRKEALRLIKKLYNMGENCLYIHYSSYSYEQGIPRITSISVKFFSGQTKTFSINKEAVLSNITDITKNLDQLEKALITKFISFSEKHQGYNWIHWNMRNEKFGFNVIENRAFSLKVSNKYKIPVERRFDLAILLKNIYSEKYASHPRLENLAIMNKMDGKIGNLWKTGKEEANLALNFEFKDIENSNIEKVDFIEEIHQRTAENKLKNKAKITDIYSFLNPHSIVYFLQNNWIGYFITLILGGIIGAVISLLFAS